MTVDFDALANAAQTGDRNAVAGLWESVMRLQSWHFVVVGEFEMDSNSPNVFVSTVDDQRMLFVFTDSHRAGLFASNQKINVTTPDHPEERIAIISQPLPNAVHYVEQFQQAGIEAVVFNYGVNTNGFYLPITSVGQSYRHAVATIHDFDEMATTAFTPGENQDHDIGKLLFFLLSLPEWHFVGDSEHDGAPVRVRMDTLDENAVAVFTDGVRARNAIENLVKGQPHHGAMTIESAIDYVEKLSEHDVQHVVFNLGTTPFHLKIDRLRQTFEDVVNQRMKLAEMQQQQLQQQAGEAS